MTPVEAMNAIEGQRFATLANLASNLKSFLRIVTDQAEIKALSGTMSNDPAVTREVFQRALAISSLPASGEQEAEGDAALATYLWLLKRYHGDLVPLFAGIASEPLRFFWARKQAEDLCRSEESANGNAKEANAERVTEAM